ncbi:unnamed protein product [Gongylonema pulchrum]|uniref:Secreted protein n=1 Tax=Gongylonema pulchrum TaxID=637853 RepID=A0A183E3S2_9BILA|nr:unnamed protein product [Gongylonema pulchrum]
MKTVMMSMIEASLVTVLMFATSITAEVEEVSCTADAINVVMNKSDPDVQRWMSDPKAQPVVYWKKCRAQRMQST